MSLNASNSFFDLRVSIIEGLAVDKSVLSNPRKDLLVVFGAHLHATDGQIFDLGEEIIVWLGDSTLVILVSLKELHVQFGRLSHFTFEPGHDSLIIGIGHGDSGLLRPNELELAVFILLEKLLGEGRLGLRDNRVARWIVRYKFAEISFLGRSDGNDSGESE